MIIQIVRKCIEWLLQLHLRTKHIHLSLLYSHVDRHADYTMFVMALTLISLKAVYTMIHSLCSVRNISCFYILVNAIFEQGIDWGSVWSCLGKWTSGTSQTKAVCEVACLLTASLPVILSSLNLLNPKYVLYVKMISSLFGTVLC